MKRNIIILAFLLSTSIIWGQNTSLWGFGSGIVGFQGGIASFTPPTWADTIYNDYVLINNHFSSYFQDEIKDYFDIVLDEEYVMPDESDNYYKIFGYEGQGKKIADWLHYVSFYDTLYQSTLSIPKTGDVMQWHLEDSIYNQNNIPNHKVTNSGEGLLTSTDGFTGVNGTTYMAAANFTGEIPNYQFTFNRLFVNSCGYFGESPNFNQPTAQRVNISRNFFTSIQGIDGFLNSNLEQFIASECDLDETSVDLVLDQLNDFYTINTPTKSVTINLSEGSSSSPSATGETYITSLEAIFDLTAHTITITTN